MSSPKDFRLISAGLPQSPESPPVTPTPAERPTLESALARALARGHPEGYDETQAQEALAWVETIRARYVQLLAVAAGQASMRVDQSGVRVEIDETFHVQLS